MNEIRIDNLTKHQVHLLDCMWSCETEDEFNGWYFCLDAEDQEEVDVLMRVVAIELVEQKLVEKNPCVEAKTVLSRFMLNKQ